MFDIYKIPSSSMNNTLYTNDVIMVNKLKYGPKLPRSPFEIPWVNIAFYFNDNAKKRIHENWWPYKRLSGYSQIKNGDVLVFNMPFGANKNMVIVKRCMGISGDTISIKKGDVYINNKFFAPSNLILNKYEIILSDRKTFYKKLDSLNIDIGLSRTSKGNFITTLSHEVKNKLEKLSGIENITRVTDTLSPKSTAYPDSKYNQWNFDDYGPYLIPRKDMKINLNKVNYSLYGKLINKFENIQLKEVEGSYFINEEEVISYTFKQDYYFMMGDNRKGSMDSRYWGLVPEERIIGKVQCVLWSNYQDEFQWNRFFKSVD